MFGELHQHHARSIEHSHLVGVNMIKGMNLLLPEGWAEIYW
jgi:hypothetical protein